MQGMWVLFLVWEDATCCKATKPMHQTIEPAVHKEEKPPFATTKARAQQLRSRAAINK